MRTENQLTVRQSQGQNEMSRYAYRAGPANPVIVGASSATRGRFFIASRLSMAAECGTPLGVPVLRPVLPTRIQSATQSAGKLIVADSSSERRSPTMSQDKSVRASRAPAQTVINANGTTSEIRWVKEPTAEKRLRRHLAKSGCSLVKTRPGSRQYDTLGELAILDESGELVADRINLAAWLRSYGLLADDERIDPPLGQGWKYHVARSRTEVIDGQRTIINEQLTGEYTTEKAARKAAEGIVDRENLVVVGRDATREGVKNA